MAKYLMGIDCGGTMAKAALFDLQGREIGVASRKIETLSPAPGQFERDANGMWRDTAAAIREVIEKSGVNPPEIVGVACTGHGNGLYLTDKQGVPVRNGVISTDKRALSYIEAWQAQSLDEKVRPKTMQSLWAGQPNALLAWLKDHEPGTLKKAGWVLMCKDFIRFKLTGAVQAELTDMSGTSLLNLQTRQYDPELFDLWGISELITLMPPLVQTAEICGKVTTEAAALTKLQEGTPVAGGMFDIDACGLATGMLDENQLCMVAGTWGCNQFVSKVPVIDKDVFMTSCYSIPGYYLMLEGSPTSASNFEWFVSEFFAADKQLPEHQGKPVFQICDELLEKSEPDMGLFFLPFLMGANVNPYAKACFIGLTARHTRGDLIRAIFEGVIFSHLWHVKRLMKFTRMPGCIRLTGGVAKNEAWVQMFADCFQVPVQIPDGSELGALGAAIAAGVACQCFATYAEACGAMVHLTRTQTPDVSKKDYFEEKYRRYTKILAGLEPIWKEIN